MTLSTRTAIALSSLIVCLWLAGCGGDDAESTGHDTPEDLIAAHVEAGRTYDLAAGCRLRPPEQLEVAAMADDVDLDGYCEFATADVVAMADDATRARTEAIYTDPVIEPVIGSDNTFRITAADNSYEEEVTAVEHDGKWYVGDIAVHLHEDDEVEHGHDEEDPNGETGVGQSGAEDQPG